MREITAWESFDGKMFPTEEKCLIYETNHIFRDPSQICFYSNHGKKIPAPNDEVFLDSNRFEAFTLEALRAYQEYCTFLGIASPAMPEIKLSFPLHYVFVSGSWHCMEEQIALIQTKMEEEFKEEFEEKRTSYHGLIGDEDG